MHVHLRPIVFQPVPAPRPVPRIAPSRVEAVKVKAVAGLLGDGRGGGGAQPSPGRRRHGRPQADTPPRDPAAGLAMTLALLALAGAEHDRAVPQPAGDHDAVGADQGE